MRVLLALLFLPLPALARPMRPRFEPTDLELEQPGTVEVDLQFGFIQSRGPYRVVAPDVEIDIGILENLELDLDWTYAAEQPFDHSAQDNVWLALKVGLVDVRRHGTSWALGLQFGPRLGAAPGARGGGFESLVLVAYERRRLHLVLNTGGLIDPPIDRARPMALEAGIDVQIDLTPKWALTGEVGAVYFLSGDPSQITISAGFAWSPREWLSFALTGLVGFLDGGDRWGILLGYSQKLALR